jgi:tRNA-splicing endonuclease subunit Sen34
VEGAGRLAEPARRSLTPPPPPLQKLATEESGKVLIPLTSKPAADARPPPAEWWYPTTAAEALRLRVFLDLHARGCAPPADAPLPRMRPPDARRYTMTSGAKFGGDYLAYPGDPLLYHAQFTVRCVHCDAPQHPLALAAATRMAHAARKHVVLASLHPGESGEGDRVEYVTFAPDIAQSTNRDRSAYAYAAPRGAARERGRGKAAAAAEGAAAVGEGVGAAGAEAAAAMEVAGEEAVAATDAAAAMET